MTNFNELNAERLDILREIGNIGAGNAATALADLIGKKIGMNIPKVQFLAFNEVTELLGGADVLVAGILIELDGDLKGFMMFLLKYRHAKVLINQLMGVEDCDLDGPFEEMEISALQEITNILTGSYLNSVATLTGFTVSQSVPLIAIDMAGAILSCPAIEFGKIGDSVLFVESEFSDVVDEAICGNFFLVPELGSFQLLIDTLRGE